MEEFIFISAAREDIDFVQFLCDNLKKEGFAVVDRHSHSFAQNNNHDDEQRMYQAIQQCSVMLVVVTEHSISRASCEREWRYAWQSEKAILPLIVEDVVHVPSLLRRRRPITFAGDVDRTQAMTELCQYLRWLQTPSGYIQTLRDRLVDLEHVLASGEHQDPEDVRDEIDSLQQEIMQKQRGLTRPLPTHQPSSSTRPVPNMDTEQSFANLPVQRQLIPEPDHLIEPEPEGGTLASANLGFDRMSDIENIPSIQTQAMQGIEEDDMLPTIQAISDDVPVSQAERREDWEEAPDITAFLGRQQDIDTVSQWIVSDQCRLIGIFGIGGMGKTMLAAKIAHEHKEQFEYIIWRSLRNAPPFKDFVNSCIEFLMDKRHADRAEHANLQPHLLLEFFREQRCLLILDNGESILRGSGSRVGSYREGYEGYGQLLRSIGEVRHRSLAILTSREKPREFAYMGNATFVKALNLAGLTTHESRMMLQDKHLSGPEDAWEQFRHNYSGNPLVLKLTSENICELFGGDIQRFLRSGATMFGDTNDLLEQQFQRLSSLEQEILYWLAIEREPLSADELQATIITPMSKRAIIEALGDLRRRSLVDQRDARFMLQNVVMEYVIERLITHVCHEIVSQDIALLKSHTLMKAQAKQYIRNAQIQLIVNEVLDILIQHFGNKLTVAHHLAQLIAHVRHVQNECAQHPGYAVGNIVNLLIHARINLNGYDFSHLPVWQAYLSGVSLQDANFAHADLRMSVFAEAFGGILSATYSPDGKFLVAGTTCGEIRMWQVEPLKHVGTLPGHIGWVRSVAFCPQGHRLVSGGEDETVRVWDVETQTCIRVLQEHARRVHSVGISPDGTLLASAGDDKTVRLWDALTGQCRLVLEGHNAQVRSICFNPHRRMLASVSTDTTVRLWDIDTGTCMRILHGHKKRVWSVAFSPDGGKLITGSEDHTITVWDVDTGTLMQTLEGHTSWIWVVAFHPNNKTVASGAGDRTIRLWDSVSGECLATFQGHSYGIRTLAFHPNGRILVSGSEDQTLRMWDTTTGECIQTLQGHTVPFRSVACSPDGHMLASGSADYTVRLWNMETGTCAMVLRGHTDVVRAVAFSRSGNVLVSGSKDTTVRVWDAHSGRCLTILRGHSRRVWAVAVTSDGQTAASSSGGRNVRIWDIATGTCRSIIQGYSRQIRPIAFDDTGRFLAIGSGNEIILWDIQYGYYLKTLQGHTNTIRAIAFSPDGQVVASGGSDQRIRLWSIQANQCIATLFGHKDRITSIAFSPDGKWLISGSGDHTLRVWDVENHAIQMVLMGHAGWIWSVAFSPDGHTIASGAHDGFIKLWDIHTGACIRTLQIDRPYERMRITGARGLLASQRETLKALGAVE